jgi:hypothetical protein
MSRCYSDDLIKIVKDSDPNKAGTALALACINGNLPAIYVSVALRVTRMSIHSWFRGRPIREKNRQLVEVFTDLVESDTAKGILPAKTKVEAKKYLEEMTGRNIP